MAFFDRFRPEREPNRHRPQNTPQASTHIQIEDPERPSKVAMIYMSELDYMSRCILDYPNIETGGQLFGFWTNTGTPVVLYAIGPGPMARHHQTSFFQDQEYLKYIGMQLRKRFGLQHVGEWHSHHQMDLARPSGGDVSSMIFGVQQPGFPRMLLCIGNCTPRQTEINPFNFHVSNPREYNDALWDVIDIESPFRPLADRALDDVLIHPHTLRPSHLKINRVGQRPAVAPEDEPRVHWLTESVENVEMMKRFVGMVKSQMPDAEVRTLIDNDGEPIISINSGEFEIYFPFGFPEASPRLTSNSHDIVIRRQWDSRHTNLAQEFYQWILLNIPFTPIAPEPTIQPVAPVENEPTLPPPFVPEEPRVEIIDIEDDNRDPNGPKSDENNQNTLL